VVSENRICKQRLKFCKCRLSNPRVAGSIPAAPTNLFYILEANFTLSHCKLTASGEQLECKTEKFFAVLLGVGNNSLGEGMPAPEFRHKSKYDFVEGRGKWHVEEQAHGGADNRGAEASRGGTESGRCGARGWRIEAHALRLEGEVRRQGCEPGARSEAVA
jgi:hypothetical protein